MAGCLLQPSLGPTVLDLRAPLLPVKQFAGSPACNIKVSLISSSPHPLCSVCSHRDSSVVSRIFVITSLSKSTGRSLWSSSWERGQLIGHPELGQMRPLFLDQRIRPQHHRRRSLEVAKTSAKLELFAPAEERGSTYTNDTDTFSKYSGYIADASTAVTDLWSEYDADVIGKYYNRRPFLLARRLLQIASTLGVWLGKRWLDSKLGRAESLFEQRAAELREDLVLLGPAFVKIAQAVSSRPDIVPPVYLEQLSLLQDRIAPFSTAAALDIIEQDLGVPVELLFSDISPQPIAAASLGQVYRARLRPNGKEVAVKVQRPGVKAAIALDIFILRKLAGVVRRVAKLNTNLQAVVDEWATSLFKEMDYQAEARNGTRFRKLFGGLPDVVVPAMMPELTGPRVLVMDWVEGDRLSELSDLRLVEIGVYCSLSQLLDCGFYHADPHPGNLLRTKDGKLAYLDFGMMGEIKVDLRNALIEACVHLVNREFDALADDFVNLGLLPPNQRQKEVAGALTAVFQEAIAGGVRNISFGDLSGNLGKTMFSFSFRIPPYFSLVIRSLTVLEGIALASDPHYKVLSSSYPWIARKVLTDKSPQLRSTLRALLYDEGRFRFDRLESLLKESTRPMFGVESMEEIGREQGEEGRRVLRRVLTFALAEEGEFVREALLEEVVKGLDALGRASLDSAAEAVTAALPFQVAPPPPLAESQDAVHLSNLRKLVSLLNKGPQELSKSGAISSLNEVDYGDEEEVLDVSLSWDDVSRAMARAGDLLRGLPQLAIIAELPFPAQQQALALPLELAGRLASRALARTIRSTLPRTPAPGAPGASISGSTSVQLERR